MDHDTDFQYETLQESGNIGMAVVHIKPEFFYTKYEVKVQVSVLSNNIVFYRSAFFKLCSMEITRVFYEIYILSYYYLYE